MVLMILIFFNIPNIQKKKLIEVFLFVCFSKVVLYCEQKRKVK